MKKLLFMLIALMMGATAAMADSYTINREKLPENAQQFLTEHFPKAKVAMIKVDRHLLKKTDYDVKLVDGTKIEFSNSGKWTSVSRKKGKAVPDGIVPKAIRNYVAKNYPGETITKSRRNRRAMRSSCRPEWNCVSRCSARSSASSASTTDTPSQYPHS